MRYMIIVKATPATETGVFPPNMAELMAVMESFHEELARAGVLLDASGLKPSANGWRVRYDGGKRSVIDGPFTESKELIAGYTLIQAASREEAMEWTQRFPNPAIDGGQSEIEVRPLFELDDFAPSDAIGRFRKLEQAR